MNKKLLLMVSGLLIVLLTLTIFIWVKQEDLKQQQIRSEQRALSHTLFDRNVGKLESIHDYEDNHLLAAYYPVLGIQNVDNEILSYVNSRIEIYVQEHQGHFIESRPVLNIDYNSYQINERFVSIYFEETVYSEIYANVTKIPKAFLVDIQEQKIVDVLSFFKEGALEQLSQLAQNEYSQMKDSLFVEGFEPTKENYRNLVFKKDSVIIVFEKYQILPGYYGQQEVMIPYESISDFLVYDTEGKVIEEIVQQPIIVEQEPELDTKSETKYIAFTFDDGPFPEVTNRIMNALNSVDGHGTFFVVGNRVGQYADSIVELFEHGHQIGNHSYNHTNLAQIDTNSINEQINATNQAISSIIGQEPNIVRPTFGETSDVLLNTSSYPLINWSIDSLDWKTRDAGSVVQEVLADLHPNAIVLFHDLYPSTADAIEQLVPQLTEMGYKFVTINQLAQVNGLELEPHQVYWKIDVNN